jgi:hypothetical protein
VEQMADSRRGRMPRRNLAFEHDPSSVALFAGACARPWRDSTRSPRIVKPGEPPIALIARHGAR